MPGTIPLEQLFLDKFVEVNQSRYQDDLGMLPLFINLTLDEIVISDLVPGVAEPQVATVTSKSRNFRGLTQRWLPAFLDTPFAFFVQNKGNPLASVSELANQETPGAYIYLAAGQSKVGFVLPFNTAEANKQTAIRTLFLDKFRYYLDPADLSTTTSQISITMNAFARGTLPYVIGKEGIKLLDPYDYGLLTNPTE